MERSVSAPRGNLARGNQGVERPVPARRRRTHATPKPTVIVGDIFAGTHDSLPSHLPPHLRPILGLKHARTTLTAHTPNRVPLLAADSSVTSSATKRGASASSSTAAAAARADKDKRSPTKALSFPRIVRRVQAIVEVPVKEEEEEDGEGNLELGISRPDPEPGTHHSVLLHRRPTTAPIGNGGGGGGGSEGRGEARRRKSSASSHRRRSLIAPSDDGNYGYVDGEEPPSDESDDDDDGGGGGEYVDEEEVENAITANGATPSTTMRTIGGGRKTVPWGRKHIRPEPDDEDDELMMYAKVRVVPPFSASSLSCPCCFR
jgi:hypothetical protein